MNRSRNVSENGPRNGNDHFQSVGSRPRRTRARLQQALRTLVEVKPYDAITVEEICRAANVGRSTFYVHFRRKDELKESGLATLHERLRAKYADHADQRRHSLPHSVFYFSSEIFAHAKENLTHYRAIAPGRGSVIALSRLRRMVNDLVRKDLAAQIAFRNADPLSFESAVHHISGAFIGLLTWWLDGGARVPVEKISEVFRHLAVSGIDSRSVETNCYP
jgi:AcrR family transcriptional regulator